MFLSLKTTIRRMLTKSLKLQRPTTWPYVTGDSFRALSQHVLDECSTIDPLGVEDGDVIFVRTPYLKDFFSTIEPNIKKAFILLSHNDDTEIDADMAAHADNPKITHWFAENLKVAHEKITPLPIGLANFYLHQNGSKSTFNTLRTLHTEKDAHIAYGFSTKSNPAARGAALEALTKHNAAKKIEEIDQIAYYKTLMKYRFVASPAGVGEDCNRTWEALYLGVIPIVTRSPLTTYFEKIGIPLLIIDSWSNLSSYTREKLEFIYAEKKAALDTPSLWMKYWAEEITAKNERR